MVWVWLILGVIFLIAEISTVQFVSIWLSLAAFVTAIVAGVGGPIWLQATVFVVCSAALVAATRPFVEKFLKNKNYATNLDMLTGKDGIVTERIDNNKSEGAIKIDGKIWTARSSDGSVIEPDTLVVFERIDGNKAIVSKK